MSIYKPLVIKQKVILAFSKFNSFLLYCSYNLFYNILCESIIYMDEETNQGKKYMSMLMFQGKQNLEATHGRQRMLMG